MFKKILHAFFYILIIGIIAGCGYYIYNHIDNSGSVIEGIPFVSTYDSSNSEEEESKSIENLNVINSTTNYNSSATTSTTNNNKYYYNQLGSNAKIIYSGLENNIDHLKEDNFKINFSTKFNDLLNQTNGKSVLDRSFQAALDAFFYDHPELFYIDLTKINLVTKYTTVGNKTTYSVSLSPQNNKNYLADGFSSQTQVDAAIIQVEAIKNTIVNHVSGDDYNKALIVHDTLVDLLDYDETLLRTNTHNIYGALIEHDVVCEGYAKAFKYIMDALNISCVLVSGTATNSSGTTESHMWNYIILDNKWYGVDVTWDDPVIIGASSKSSKVRRDYFCKGKNSFASSHKADGKISENGETFSIPTLSESNYK